MLKFNKEYVCRFLNTPPQSCNYRRKCRSDSIWKERSNVFLVIDQFKIHTATCICPLYFDKVSGGYHLTDCEYKILLDRILKIAKCPCTLNFQIYADHCHLFRKQNLQKLSSGCIRWAALFYCGTLWAFHIIILNKWLVDKVCLDAASCVTRID